MEIKNGIYHKASDPPPPLNGKISRHFLPHFFSFAIESFIYDTDFTQGLSQKNTFNSSYNWFKIDIQQQLRPLTANYLAMFKVNYYIYII